MKTEDLIKEIDRLKLYRQSRIVRWQLRDFIFPENDSEHQLFVTQMAIWISHKLKIDEKTELDAIRYAAVHDYVESCSGVGDVNFALKERNPELKKVVKELERKAMESVPPFLFSMNNCEKNEKASLIVDVADTLDALMYVKREISFNPSEEWLIFEKEIMERLDNLWKKLISLVR